MPAASESFDTLLKAWGLCYAERRHNEPRRRVEPSHPIARQMQFSPGKKARRLSREELRRDGESRRRIMATSVNAGVRLALRMVPTWSADPVPCRETRSRGAYHERPVPPELQRVEHEAKGLEEAHMLRGLVFRAQYCVEGNQEEKADWVTVEFRKAKRDFEPLSVTKFRNELAFARVWMQARLNGAGER